MILLIVALLAGAALPFAFAPFGLYTLAFISPAILLYTWINATPKQAFIRGLLFGIGFFGIGASWIYISIHRYGNAPLLLAATITALFVLLMAAYPATQGYVLRKFFKNNLITQCLCAFPATWVLWELLRGWLFTGFPWLFLGYSQTNTLLRSLAPVVGIYGLSFAIALISGSLVLLGLRNINTKTKVSCVIIIMLIPLAGWIFKNKQWTTPAGKPITVSLIQGNIKQSLKWNPQQLKSILQTYQKLTTQNWNSKLIIWPEAAVPTFPQEVGAYLTLMNNQAKKHHSDIIFGAPIYKEKSKHYYNGMMVIGDNKGLYLKRHLVPFGEYIPLKMIFAPIFKSIKIPMSDFSPGAEHQAPFIAQGISIAPFICYEIAYPDEVLDSMKNTQMIVTITDDSWFGKSMALAQHLQIAQMRALETGRYLLLSTNTGISAFINAQGKITAKAPIDKTTVLTSKATPMQGATPLMRWEYYPVLGILFLLLLIALLVS